MTQTSDYQEVLNMVHRYFAAVDSRDWDGLRALHADTITVDFGGLHDDSDGSVSADDFVRSVADLLDPVELIHHIISNEIVTIDGDVARVEFYEAAVHHHQNLGVDRATNSWTMFARGEHGFTRSADGWKLARSRLRPVHNTGNENFMTDLARLI